uniref:Meprin A subunit beta n=2 Tax=Anas platyrhynchos TaxID=8839 RepID=U3IIG8_ANAPP
MWKKPSVVTTLGFRMSVPNVLLFVLLLAGVSLSQQASGPSCTAVEDFKACLGDTEDFCPTNISCQCKNEKPFCRCDYYKEGWKDYWYMGPKCNQLWSTVDLILVAILPAVALVFIVIVIFQCVHYCSSKTEGKQTNSPYHEAQHNPAFTHELSGNLGRQQPPRDAWIGQMPKAVLRRDDFDDFPTSSQPDNYTRVYPQQSRTSEYVSNQRPQQYDRFVYPGNSTHYADVRQYQRY